MFYTRKVMETTPKVLSNHGLLIQKLLRSTNSCGRESNYAKRYLGNTLIVGRSARHQKISDKVTNDA